VRQGQALQVTLVDGRMVTIEGFFSPEGAIENDLMISANGSLSKVDLTAGEGNLLYAQYVDADSFGKWSPDDDLYFVRGSEVMVAGVEAADAETGMLFTPLLGGLGGLGGLGAGRQRLLLRRLSLPVLVKATVTQPILLTQPIRLTRLIQLIQLLLRSLVALRERWSREFGPVVKVDRMKKVMIQNDKKKEPFARFQSQGCA